jgi:cytoskeleton protein RodZ
VEEDHFDVLRNAAFARGYVKAYGRILGVNEAELLAAFDGLQAARRGSGAGRPVRRTPPQLQRVGLGIATGLFILLLLVIALWWRGGPGQSATETAPVSSESAAQDR